MFRIRDMKVLGSGSGHGAGVNYYTLFANNEDGVGNGDGSGRGMGKALGSRQSSIGIGPLVSGYVERERPLGIYWTHVS